MNIILITGMSGSGKTVALTVLEDSVYYCVDNLLPELLPTLVAQLPNISSLAVTIDARSASHLALLSDILMRLRQQGHNVSLLFLDASNHAITQRFSETRRPHPLSVSNIQRSLPECIAAERELLSALFDLGHRIDTSNLRPNQLREWIKNWLDLPAGNMALCLMSFGFKNGVPHEADFIFDVRTLPNPYYDTQLRPQSGKDIAVQKFLQGYPEVAQTVTDIHQYLHKRLPAFVRDNRSYLTLAIGCTGGQHRSVYIVECLAKLFATQPALLVQHRDCTH